LAKAIVNATGVFTDAVLEMDDAHPHKLVTPSQGIHLVIPDTLFPGSAAMMIPKTDDGRVLFAVPWMGKVLLGTTDTGVDSPQLEPRAQEAEIEFILSHINRYGTRLVQRSDVLSVYAGLRPLVSQQGNGGTAMLSRDHTLIIAPSGLVTITGGKWTTYRKMAQDAVDNASFVAKLPKKTCITYQLSIGFPDKRNGKIQHWITENLAYAERIHPAYKYTKADVIYAIRHELAVTIEDVLARRTRLLFLDARAAIYSAQKVASWMAAELGKDSAWETQQVTSFELLAHQYLIQ
jgi:glycerol-3-phosphate dehydrogenase